MEKIIIITKKIEKCQFTFWLYFSSIQNRKRAPEQGGLSVYKDKKRKEKKGGLQVYYWREHSGI
jgi:hypothetical protein